MTSPAINFGSDMPLPKEVQQQDTMRTMRFRDQHGRAYTTVVSIKTLEPCTVLTPEGWRAPLPMLSPPSKYFRFSSEEVGQTRIDYDQWITDLTSAEREYRTWVLEIAKREFGGAALQKIESRDIGLRAMAGPAPQSPELVRAMKAGNKWALGQRKLDGTPYNRPTWADEYVDGWTFESTYDGGDVNLSASYTQYPDEDDDAVAVAARYEAASQYQDVEEDADPTGLPDFTPIKRGRGRPPKER